MDAGSLLFLLLALPVLVTCDGRALPGGNPRIFLLSIGHDYGAHEYIDAAGYLTGFIHDLIDAVCLEGEMDCRTVWDKYDNCWKSNGASSRSTGGKGIMDRYYDACVGWDATRERIHVFQFSSPYTHTLKSYFFYKKNTFFDERSLAGKSIGFMRGWASSEACVASLDDIQGNKLAKNYIKHFDTPDELLEAIKNSQIDAAFADELTFSQDEVAANLNFQASRPYLCILAGNSLMSRKDNDVCDFWNYGFHKLKNSGRYRKLCAEGTVKHGHRGDLFCLGT